VSHDPYAAFRVRNYRWFIVSLLMMTVAAQIQGVVVSWQIYDLTHDPLSLGLMGLAEALPYIGVALYAGHVADQLNRRYLAIASLTVLLGCSLALLVFNLIPNFLREHGAWPFYAVSFAMRRRSRTTIVRPAGPERSRRRAGRTIVVRERRRMAKLDLADRGGARTGARRIDLRLLVGVHADGRRQLPRSCRKRHRIPA